MNADRHYSAHRMKSFQVVDAVSEVLVVDEGRTREKESVGRENRMEVTG
jgi:hypothetical protein